MSFDWKKYLELAEYLAKNSGCVPDGEEACFRASISRAYYAAFCTARGYLRKSGEKECDGGDAHKKVRELFLKSKDMDPLKRKIGHQLQDLHFNRIKADYGDNISHDKPSNLAFKSVTISKHIISEIKELENHHVIG